MDEVVPIFATENDLFNFESDHLALRGNEDYCDVLKALVILSAQRECALKDYKTVAEKRVEALSDPFATLEKIKNGSDLGIPPLSEIPKLPVIDFKKYNVKVSESDIAEIYSKGSNKVEDKNEVKSLNSNNRAWSPEEQKRLEELLQVYPPEPVELRRYQKIAKALGNRTVQQVSSRIQKYFLKLYKAGLPIPGRIPKSGEKYKKSVLHKHQRHNHYLWKPTTFFPKLSVPVKMEDLNDIPGPSDSMPSPSADTSTNHNYLVTTDYLHTAYPEKSLENENEVQLKLLKRIREIKRKELNEGYVAFSHFGYKCDYCDEEPIGGPRWHCTACPDSVDFCTDCLVSQMVSDNPHPLSHNFLVYEDDSMNLDWNGIIPEQVSAFDKQIEEEIKGENFRTSSDNEEYFENNIEL